MRALDHIHEGLTRIAALVRPREPVLVCGQCDRWQRCGSPPSDRCIAKLAQIERERDRIRHLSLMAY